MAGPLHPSQFFLCSELRCEGAVTLSEQRRHRSATGFRSQSQKKNNVARRLGSECPAFTPFLDESFPFDIEGEKSA